MATVLPTLAPPFAGTPRWTPVVAASSRGGWHLGRDAVSVLLLLVGDTIALLLSLALLTGARDDAWAGLTTARVLNRVLPDGVLPTVQVVCAVLLSLVVMNTYGAATRGKQVGLRLAGASCGLVLPYWNSLWNGSPVPALTAVTVLALVTLAALTVERRLLTPVLRSVAERSVGPARVLLIGTPGEIQRAAPHPALADHRRFNVVGTYDPAELRQDHSPLEGICRIIHGTDADTMMLSCGPLGDRAFRKLLDAAIATGCELIALRPRCSMVGAEPRVVWSNGMPLIALTRSAARSWQLVAKRVIDVVVAAASLLLLMPLMVAIAMAIKLEGPGPVLFGHWRMGFGGRRFRCLKFRSMHLDAEVQLRQDQALYAAYLRNDYKLPCAVDPRITRFGRVLRATSLDELPQLWNVLRGEMSLVGPRPVVPEELQEYRDGATLLLSLKPGLSGAWAVQGRSQLGYPQRAKVELAYVRQWRFGLDVAILARTLPAVLSRRGAH